MTHPLLYEINTRCWLRELSQKHGSSITLQNVPETELENWQRLGFTHIWLMGVWTSGPLARKQALGTSSERPHYTEALPDWRPEDVVASPYAIAAYKVPAALGGEAGLSEFRKRLYEHGLKLLLDFVPNHLGVDHPWLTDLPELFVQSPTEVPGTFLQQTKYGPRWLAHGKDPYFGPWTDTVQLDYRRPQTRRAMTQLLEEVAALCDGVRCDVAMLLLNDVFARTWQHLPPPGANATGGQLPQHQSSSEFWTTAISAVKKARPSFLFLAEVYWGLEGHLQTLGFDYTYDKELYDRIVARDAAGVQRHVLTRPLEYIAAGAHFLENHDERRIASMLSPAEHRAAALLLLALPGMRFLHEGQLTGARARMPVQLLRRPTEPPQSELAAFYEQLLSLLPQTCVGSGKPELLKPRAACNDNPTAENFIAIQWQSNPAAFDLVVVNLAKHQAQCLVALTVTSLGAHSWRFKDQLSGAEFMRSGEELTTKGLFLDLPAQSGQFFRVTRA